MKRNILLFTLLCYISTAQLQTISNGDRDRSMRFCFYNMENMFDCENDSNTNDDTYTPEGMHHWTYYRYKQKQNNIAKVLIAMGGWSAPDIVGVCEVENRKVLNDLISNTPLKACGYGVVHYESPDARGIDVALLYRKDKFKVIDNDSIQIVYPGDSISTTRNILYVQGVAAGATDTLHIFVCHWPSRFGGYAQTMAKRNYTAQVLRAHVDAIIAANASAKVICCGDFNDYPDNESVSEVLRARSPKYAQNDDYIHLLYPYFNQNNVGTHKYQGWWGILDHLVVNKGLYEATSGYRVEQQGHIFSMDFMLEKDDANMGLKPYRTYVGMKYNGGFSDHLPVYVDISY